MDTQLDDCQIRETPMQETRLRQHGSGNDGPVFVGPGVTKTLNVSRTILADIWVAFFQE